MNINKNNRREPDREAPEQASLQPSGTGGLVEWSDVPGRSPNEVEAEELRKIIDGKFPNPVREGLCLQIVRGSRPQFMTAAGARYSESLYREFLVWFVNSVLAHRNDVPFDHLDHYIEAFLGEGS